MDNYFEGKLLMSESEDKIVVIQELINNFLNTEKNILVSSRDFIERIRSICIGEDIAIPPLVKDIDHIIVSCDASIKTNPGGQASIATVIQIPGREQIVLSQLTEDKTNNQAEYSAVYLGLNTLIYHPNDLYDNPNMYIEVRTDSKLVVDQLNNKIVCKDETLLKKRNSILDLINQLIIGVGIRWFPRNSTPELTLCNRKAQELIGVKKIH
jgi:ribonuclease HI